MRAQASPIHKSFITALILTSQFIQPNRFKFLSLLPMHIKAFPDQKTMINFLIQDSILILISIDNYIKSKRLVIIFSLMFQTMNHTPHQFV